MQFRSISIAEVWVWCLALAAVGYWSDVISQSPAADPVAGPAIFDSILRNGAFNLAAWVMILRRAGVLATARAASPSGIAAAIVLGLLCAMPTGPPAALALALLGLALILAPGPAGTDINQASMMQNRRETGLLMLGLAGNLGGPFARLIHVAAGKLDAHFVAWAVHLAGINAVAQGNLISTGGFAIEVLPACSSSAPLPGVVLAYIVVVLFRRRSPGMADAPWLAASLLVSIGLTEVRLSLMLPTRANWDWWHNGPGANIYALTALVAATFFPLIASLRPTALTANQRSGEPAA